jgi:hypothetical protein
MNTVLPHKLPTATFHAGEMSHRQMKYPHLTSAPMHHDPAVHYPGLSKTGCMVPKTKRPMGMTLPILTKMGAHPTDTSSQLPPFGSA